MFLDIHSHGYRKMLGKVRYKRMDRNLSKCNWTSYRDKFHTWV